MMEYVLQYLALSRTFVVAAKVENLDSDTLNNDYRYRVRFSDDDKFLTMNYPFFNSRKIVSLRHIIKNTVTGLAK